MSDDQPSWLQSASQSFDRNVTGSLSHLTDRAAKDVAKLTKDNLGIKEDTARGVLPWLAGGAAAAIGVLLLEPIQFVTKNLFRAARQIVTGFGLLEKIPLIGGLFTALGDAVEGLGEIAGYVVPAIAAFIGYKAFQARGEGYGQTPGGYIDTSSTPAEHATHAAGLGAVMTAGTAYKHFPAAQSDISRLHDRMGGENWVRFKQQFGIDDRPLTGQEVNRLEGILDSEERKFTAARHAEATEAMNSIPKPRGVFARIALSPITLPLALIQGTLHLGAKAVKFSTLGLVKLPGHDYNPEFERLRVERIRNQFTTQANAALEAVENYEPDGERVSQRFARATGRTTTAGTHELRLTGTPADVTPTARADVGTPPPATEATTTTPKPEVDGTTVKAPKPDLAGSKPPADVTVTRTPDNPDVIARIERSAVPPSVPDAPEVAARTPGTSPTPTDAPAASPKLNMRGTGAALGSFSGVQAGIGAYDLYHHHSFDTPLDSARTIVAAGNTGMGTAGVVGGGAQLMGKALPAGLTGNLFKGNVVLQVAGAGIKIAGEDKEYRDERTVEQVITTGGSLALAGGGMAVTAATGAVLLPAVLVAGTAVGLAYTGDQVIDTIKVNDQANKAIDNLRHMKGALTGALAQVEPQLKERGLVKYIEEIDSDGSTYKRRKFDLSTSENMAIVRTVIENKIAENQKILNEKGHWRIFSIFYSDDSNAQVAAAEVEKAALEGAINELNPMLDALRQAEAVALAKASIPKIDTTLITPAAPGARQTIPAKVADSSKPKTPDQPEL